jgi:hypothetical protein
MRSAGITPLVAGLHSFSVTQVQVRRLLRQAMREVDRKCGCGSLERRLLASIFIN